MEKIAPESSMAYIYVSRLINVTTSIGFSAGIGILCGRFVLPLTDKQGAMAGSCLGLVSEVAQKVAHIMGMKPKLMNKVAISALAIGILYVFVACQPSLVPALLGRAEPAITLKSMADFACMTFLGIVISKIGREWFKDRYYTPWAQRVVANLSKKELEESIKRFDERVEEKSPDLSPFSPKVADAILERIEKDGPILSGCVKIPTNDREVEALNKAEVTLLFSSRAIIPKKAFKAFYKRLKKLKLFKIPTTLEQVEEMSKMQIKWALSCYNSVVSNMEPRLIKALNECIEEHVLVEKSGEKTIDQIDLAQEKYALHQVVAEFPKLLDRLIEVTVEMLAKQEDKHLKYIKELVVKTVRDLHQSVNNENATDTAKPSELTDSSVETHQEKSAS